MFFQAYRDAIMRVAKRLRDLVAGYAVAQYVAIEANASISLYIAYIRITI